MFVGDDGNEGMEITEGNNRITIGDNDGMIHDNDEIMQWNNNRRNHAIE